MTESKRLVLEYVKKIPRGKITSYGEIAGLLDLNPRTVGFIMTGLSETESKAVPWHRVVNRDGFISASKLGERGVLQEALLKVEGIKVKEFQIIDPQKYWHKFS